MHVTMQHRVKIENDDFKKAYALDIDMSNHWASCLEKLLHQVPDVVA